MQFSLRRLCYFVLVSSLVAQAITLLPWSPDYPEVYCGLVIVIFAAVGYELNRAGYLF
jgi:hypothetical protein